MTKLNYQEVTAMQAVLKHVWLFMKHVSHMKLVSFMTQTCNTFCVCPLPLTGRCLSGQAQPVQHTDIVTDNKNNKYKKNWNKYVPYTDN